MTFGAVLVVLECGLEELRLGLAGCGEVGRWCLWGDIWYDQGVCLLKSHEASSRHTKRERLVKWKQPFLQGGWRQGSGCWSHCQGLKAPGKDLGGVPEQKGRGQRFWEHQDLEESVAGEMA